jgi:hypothetical protein
MSPNIAQICERFEGRGSFVGAEPLGSGHINDTYLVTHNDNGVGVRAILQRINHDVFKDPPALMDNITRVIGHVREKLRAEGADDISRRVLTVIPAHDGKSYQKDPDGNYWRQYVFIENGRTFDTPESPRVVYVAAKMFGQFLRMLADLPEPPLSETIVDFHNGPKRFQAFQNALEADLCNRAINAKAETDFILQHASILAVLPELVNNGQIPVRVTHNDTKINNVIFDAKTGEGLCIIDLDTVMPGLILYDFGDMVRTATCPAAEDEKDLSKVAVQIDLFEALVRGFLEETASFISAAERRNLVFAGKMITFEQAVRFLTDYLQGDIYYKTSYSEHNLDRCRTQLKLVQSIIEQQELLIGLVEKRHTRKVKDTSSRFPDDL